MSLHPERIPDYIGHMAEALERVLEYTQGMSEAEFSASRLVQDAVMRNLEILGEAANNCVRICRQLPRNILKFRSRIYMDYATS